MSKLCAILGHRRHKGRARRHLETWRSECVRCRVPMMRSARGLWTAAPVLTGKFGPNQLTSDFGGSGYPLKKSNTSGKLVIPGSAPIEYLPFPHEFASAILNDRPPAEERSEHYTERSTECRRLAAAAKDQATELIHLDMATRYDILAREIGHRHRQLHAVK